MDKFEQVKQQILEFAHQKDFAAVKQELDKIREEYPDNAELLGMLAGLSIERGDYLQAEILVRQAIQADESYIFAYFLLARIKNNEEKYDEAIQELDKLTLNYGGQIPKEMQALIYNLYGHIYKILGDPEQAANYYLSASHYTPHLWQKFENYSNYLFNLNYLTHMNDSDLFKAHEQYNEFFTNAKQYQHKVFQSHKKIRVGYISPDLRKHVVVYFVYQLMKCYNRELFEVYCYSLGNTDNISLQLRSFVDKWEDVSTLKNDKIAELIYQDEIDILVDFAGHTRNNPLPILAHKPAPIQVSGIGYFNTTGLKAIDYFITDIYVDPIGQNDEVFTEKLLRLPQTHFCYTPPATMVECSEPSYKKNGYITFGSFNNFTKVNDVVLSTWGKILARVSNAKLILKSAVFSNKTAKKEILKRIYLAGIKINQVELRSESRDYLSEYNDIDIALDPFPYPGGGTTCEALYMGVPVITLVGKRHGSRFGYSLLKNLAIEDCIAFSKEEYIEKTIDLANNFARIDFLHQNLRKIMQKSPLMDGKTYLVNIETAYEKIWLENKLINLPAERGLLNNLAIEFTNKQEYFNVLACGEKILSLNANDCEGLHIKALAYMHMNRLALAREIVVKIIAIDEMYIAAYMVLAHIYKRKGEVVNEIDVLNMIIALVESVEVEKRTVQYQNAYSEALSMLGSAQIMLGNAAKGGECFLLSSQAEQDFSQKLMEYSNFLLATHYTEEITKQNRFVMHKQYNDFFTNIKRIERVTTRKDRIRIGYISPDFRQHPVMDFSRALFTDFNHNKFEVFAYYTGTVDDTTEKIEETVTKFTFIHGKNDEEVAKLIANDEIDILVDLSGHTANSCLSILAYKPAPIQLCGLGYFNTTGLNSVDYFIGDQYCDNENTEEFFVEKIIRLPNSHFCYSPKQKFPEIKELPSMEKGYITFGSFNNFAKVNDEVLSIWCDILRNIPQSKIILKSKGFTFDDIRQATYKRFSKFGVEQNRIELRGFSTNYLEEYKEIDIALDPFPYTGGATTCEALYMGVPVLTLCGDTHGSRFGYSILKNIGLEDWIAFDKEEYLEKAIGLSQNKLQLNQLRKDLREKMEKSPLMDRKLYIENIEKEYESKYKDYIQMNDYYRNDEMNDDKYSENQIVEGLTSIVILVHNQLDYTKGCIESIRQYTETNTYEIIIIDNASTDGTKEWLGEQSDIKVIYNNENLGFPKGCNQGIAVATGSEILLLNNDVVVTTRWLENLKIALYSSDKVGAVGAITNNAGNWQSIPTSYKSIVEMQAFANEKNNSNSAYWERRLKLIGFCMLIKRDVVEKIGGLDERFTPGNFEDDDYSLRIIQAGYELLLCFDVFIHHYGSATFQKILKHTETYYGLLRNNREKFKQKWGFNDKNKISFSWMLKQVDFSTPNINILIIGCGCGGDFLRVNQVNKTAKLYGIEKNRKAIQFLEKYVDIAVGDINIISLDYEKEQFDYIIFNYGIESLAQFEQVLEKVSPYLKNTGTINFTMKHILHSPRINNFIVSEEHKNEYNYFNERKIQAFLDQNDFLLTKCDIEKEFFDSDVFEYIYLLKSVGISISEKDIFSEFCYVQAKKNNGKINQISNGIFISTNAEATENQIDNYPKVTICIICDYDLLKLQNTISTIKAQSYKRIKVVIVNFIESNYNKIKQILNTSKLEWRYYNTLDKTCISTLQTKYGIIVPSGVILHDDRVKKTMEIFENKSSVVAIISQSGYLKQNNEVELKTGYWAEKIKSPMCINRNDFINICLSSGLDTEIAIENIMFNFSLLDNFTIQEIYTNKKRYVDFLTSLLEHGIYIGIPEILTLKPYLYKKNDMHKWNENMKFCYYWIKKVYLQEKRIKNYTIYAQKWIMEYDNIKFIKDIEVKKMAADLNQMLKKN